MSLDRQWTIYVIHHSHTDIGYTDLQERITFNQIDYIREAIQIIQEGKENNTINQHFKWNCESYYCVEQFLKVASQSEKEAFFQLVKENKIGISASYLNFTDLVDPFVLDKKTQMMIDTFNQHNIRVKTAMNADVNGISLGALDVLVDNGIEFLMTNIHTHHGMYPLYQNQKPYFWKNHAGKQILVFSGEHYNLGNALGLVPNKTLNFMAENYLGKESTNDSPPETLYQNLTNYLSECVQNGYKYNFLPLCVSGVFSDNAPPNPSILSLIDAFNQLYGQDICIKMVTLEEFYEAIKFKVLDAATYEGDLTDWWANGIGSTPYAVKHYREAQRLYHLCQHLDQDHQFSNPENTSLAEDNLLLYAEHTWGHSSTITNPFDTMVLNLDLRKQSYASKAHEAASNNLNLILKSKGDSLRYYNRNGTVRVINPSDMPGKKVVHFYIEAWGYEDIQLVSSTNQSPIIAQISSHPRGLMVTFVDYFKANETKDYSYEEIPKAIDKPNSRVAYVGSERVADIVNNYDTTHYRLPYELENDYFKLQYRINEGIFSFYDKIHQRELMMDGDDQFFKPIYEATPIHENVYESRRLLGRNIRGIDAQKYFGKLINVKPVYLGSVFDELEFIYELEATTFSSLIIRIYHALPKVAFRLKISKQISNAIESIYLPLSLNLEGYSLIGDKGNVPFRLGVDQIPGTCMEYYLLDHGIAYQFDSHAISILLKDTPLVYMGDLEHHPIKLCDNQLANNCRPIYAWIMNNTWETNFKMDLSGMTEYCFELNYYETANQNETFKKMDSDNLGMISFIL